MANSNTMGSSATVLASLATLNYSLSGFIQSSTQQQPSIYYSGLTYSGYAMMAWFGVLCLAFGWTGAAYTLKRRHFDLALAGAFLIFASCIVEFFTFMYTPETNSQALPQFASALPLVIVQTLVSLVGIIFTAISKKQFR